MLNKVGTWLGIQEGELPRTAGMFLYSMMAVGAFITGRIARDALFLSRYDVSTLPAMYVWVALAVAALSYFYSRFADRYRRDRLILTVTSFLLIGVLTARVLLLFSGDWFLPVLYVFIEVMGGLLMIQIWTFANDVFTTRQAKRLFGLIGAGGVVATILAGLIIGGLSAQIGTENLLLVCAGLLVGCLAAVLGVSRICRHELTLAMAGKSPSRGISLAGDWGRVFSSKHLKVIAWITLATFAAVTIVDYQFKVIARYTFLNREDQLSAFFGWFYGVSGILSLVIQFLFTGRLLQRFGIIISLLLLPIAFFIGSIGLLIIPGLLAVTALKGADNVLRYTINDATTQVLYLPVASHVRGRAKAFIDGVLKPGAQCVCGLLLIWIGPLIEHRVDWLAPGTLLALILLTWMIVGLKKEYIQSLVNTLRERKVHFGESTFSISDSQAVAALEQTLSDDDDRNVLHALEMIPYVRRHDWSRDLNHLLEHQSPEVRLQAVRLIEREVTGVDMARVLTLMEDPDEKIRAEAVRVYCVAYKERAMSIVEPLLNDRSIRVRAAAVVGLIQYGGIDGILVAAEAIKTMLVADEAGHRQAGAWCVGQVGVKTFYRSILPLLDDPVAAVRAEAVRSAGLLKSPELILALIHRLSDPPVQRMAISALAGYGSRLLTTLRTILANPRENPNIRLAIPGILCRIDDQLSMDMLSSTLETTETELRARSLDGILLLHQRFPSLRRDMEMLRRVLHRELKQAFQLTAILHDTVALDAVLLREAIGERKRKTIERIFKLLRVIYSGRHLDAVHRNLAHPVAATRANALELLENVVDPETRRCLLPLMEERDPTRLASTGDELFPLLHHDAQGWLQQLLVSEHAWTVVSTLEAVSRLGDQSFVPNVRMHLSNADPLVRETAATCLTRLAAPDAAREALAPLGDDPHPQVRNMVAALMAVAPAKS